MPLKSVCVFSLLSVFIACQQRVHCTEMPPTCDSLIYCQGELLHTIQMATLNADSKTFVDKSMLNDVETTLRKFHEMMNKTDHNPSEDDIAAYVDANFLSENELDEWIPEDFVDEPPFLRDIIKDDIRQFAKDIVGFWKLLGRKIKDDVQKNPDQHSLIYVPNGFIVPGGRFREYYYWDSYWIIDGLLVSGMTETAKGMIDNFLSIVDQYGFVPNGGRVYYTRRSQPPLLSRMAKIYFDATRDMNWLKSSIELLEKEIEFWLKNRMVTVNIGGKDHEIAVYHARSIGPRPESYYEDFTTATFFKTETEKNELYVQLKSGAESGWDFSSRWLFDEEGGTRTNLTFINTSRVAPVDLNAFLYGAFSTIAEFYGYLNNAEKQIYWNQQAHNLNYSINAILWNDQDGIWYDYDLDLLRQRKYYSPANLAPLWTKAYNTEKQHSSLLISKIISYLKKEGIPDFLGGIPTSITDTGEQWDFPNAWPCLQSIVIEGLENSDDTVGKHWARTFAERWVEANIIGFNDTGHMYEKYNAVQPGKYGGGGEYKVQTGFGWTNGVVLKFIKKYYSK